MTRTKQDVGFNRKVKGDWLKETLRQAAAVVSHDEVQKAVKDEIAKDNAGKETIRKVFIYLNRVWLNPPHYCQSLRDAAIEMFRTRPDDHNAFLLNWGMCLAAYPFIGAVAEATGRLFRLQHSATALQINTRIREQYGDRHFVHRSVRYNLSTFLDLGAIQQGEPAGTYVPAARITPRTDEEIAWLVEALLHTQEPPSLDFDRITDHPALFPFDTGIMTEASLTQNPRLELYRHSRTRLLVTAREATIQEDDQPELNL
jgi:hypothetical protein